MTTRKKLEKRRRRGVAKAKVLRQRAFAWVRSVPGDVAFGMDGWSKECSAKEMLIIEEAAAMSDEERGIAVIADVLNERHGYVPGHRDRVGLRSVRNCFQMIRDHACQRGISFRASARQLAKSKTVMQP